MTNYAPRLETMCNDIEYHIEKGLRFEPEDIFLRFRDIDPKSKEAEIYLDFVNSYASVAKERRAKINEGREGDIIKEKAPIIGLLSGFSSGILLGLPLSLALMGFFVGSYYKNQEERNNSYYKKENLIMIINDQLNNI